MASPFTQIVQQLRDHRLSAGVKFSQIDIAVQRYESVANLTGYNTRQIDAAIREHTDAVSRIADRNRSPAHA